MTRVPLPSPAEARWVLRRAQRVQFDEKSATFHCDTRPSESESFADMLARWDADHERAEAEHRRRWQAVEYEPLTRRGLPNALARLATAAEGPDPARAFGRAKREAERFLRRWGPLGFAAEGGRSLGIEGEPLFWMIAQARTVRFALAVIEALQSGWQPDLLRALNSQRHLAGDVSGAKTRERRAISRRYEHAADRTSVWLHYDLCRKTSYSGSLHTVDLSLPPEKRPTIDLAGSACDDVSYLASEVVYKALHANARGRAVEPLEGDELKALQSHAGAIVSDLVEAHDATDRSHVGWLAQNDEREARFVEWPTRGPLLRAVWLLVKEEAVKGSRIRFCAECGTPFFATDGRQRYCPPDGWSNKSRCLTRQQMRKRRTAPTNDCQADKEQS